MKPNLRRWLMAAEDLAMDFERIDIWQNTYMGARHHHDVFDSIGCALRAANLWEVYLCNHPDYAAEAKVRDLQEYA